MQAKLTKFVNVRTVQQLYEKNNKCSVIVTALTAAGREPRIDSKEAVRIICDHMHAKLDAAVSVHGKVFSAPRAVKILQAAKTIAEIQAWDTNLVSQWHSIPAVIGIKARAEPALIEQLHRYVAAVLVHHHICHICKWM